MMTFLTSARRRPRKRPRRYRSHKKLRPFPGPVRAAARAAAFTLLELLLTIVLVLMLISAAVFSFQSLRRGQELQQGATRLRTLFLYARAQAAQTGRRVQIGFEQDVTEDFEIRVVRMPVTWEPNPLTEPGKFVPLLGPQWTTEGICELVDVETVEQIEPGMPPKDASTLLGDTEEDTSADELLFAPALLEEGLFDEFPKLTFYPDGSCDDARVVLASRDPEDQRRIELRLLGVTGLVQQRVISEEGELGEAAGESPGEGSGETNASSASTGAPVEDTGTEGL